MKKIIFNKSCLPDLVRRITENGHGTKSMIVDALNEKDDKRKTSLSQLNLWIKDEAVLPTKKIINLINNMGDVSLFDFFIYEDGTRLEETLAPLPSLHGKRGTKIFNEIHTSFIQNEPNYTKFIDEFLQKSRDREDEIRQDYENKMAKRESELREIILSKESEIMLYKKLLKDKEMEIMKNQVEQLEKLLSKLDDIKELPENSEESNLWRTEVDDLFRTMYGQYSSKYKDIHNFLFFIPLATPTGDMNFSITYKDRLDKVREIIKENIS